MARPTTERPSRTTTPMKPCAKTAQSKQEGGRSIANAQANDSQHPSAQGRQGPGPNDEWSKDGLYRRAQELDIRGPLRHGQG